jgi:hypothetical protein
LTGQSTKASTARFDQGSILEPIQEVLVGDTLAESSEQLGSDHGIENQTQNPTASQTEKSPTEVIKILCLFLAFLSIFKSHFLSMMLMIHWLRLKMYPWMVLNKRGDQPQSPIIEVPEPESVENLIIQA